jgi:hypothetical protein
MSLEKIRELFSSDLNSAPQNTRQIKEQQNQSTCDIKWIQGSTWRKLHAHS